MSLHQLKTYGKASYIVEMYFTWVLDGVWALVPLLSYGTMCGIEITHLWNRDNTSLDNSQSSLHPKFLDAHIEAIVIEEKSWVISRLK